MRARTGTLLSRLIAMALGVAVAVLAGEAGVRLLWTDAPQSIAPADSLPLEQVRDPEVLYRLIPDASGHFNGTEIRLNSMGLRDRDYPIPKPAGAFRIVVLGDSMVFGVGLPPEETLPGQLSRLLGPVEVINAGVFGYNLAQEISLLRAVGLKYQPDVVVSCFVHNDIDNWGLGDGGAVPEIRSSRFDPPPRDAWSTRLADLMLPDTFDPERLNLLPRTEQGAGMRARLASMSRLYLFAYLRLRTHSWNLTGGERRDPLVGSPACQAEEVIWEPLRRRYRELRASVQEAGARLLVVIQGGLLWEGRPLARLRALLSEERIPFLDLSPVWVDPGFYARNYSLGWDPHPNARANRLAAELTAAYLREAGMLPGAQPAAAAQPGPDDVVAARPDLEPRLRAWKLRQERLALRELEAWEDAAGSFAPQVELGDAAAGGSAQVLYGFWEAEALGPKPDSGRGRQGRWMSGLGAVLLRPQPGVRSCLIDLELPAERAALERTPGRLRVTFGAPPDRCVAASRELEVDRGGVGGRMSLRAELGGRLEGAGLIEVGLAVDRPFPASYLNPGTRDARQVSFLVRRIALE